MEKLVVRILSSIEGIAEEFADQIIRSSNLNIEARGHFTIAISGGSAAAFLASLTTKSSLIDFSKWKIAFVDERCVPLVHNDSNFKECQARFFSQISSLSPSNILAISEDLHGESLALDYEERLKQFLGCGDEVRFDVCVLGMGPDGHTASLFPGHPLTRYHGERCVLFVSDSPKPPAERITLSLSTINRSTDVVFLACGASKADPVSQILSWDSAASCYCWKADTTLPAGLVRAKGSVTWYLDAAAASELTTSQSI